MGSGGGFRAMVGLSGAINALESSGVLNCATYTVGLSGSAW
jgi:phospholipase A2